MVSPTAAGDTRTYGTAAKTVLALTPWDFRPFSLGNRYQVNQGTAIGTTLSLTTGALLVAPLHLPDGALVTEIEAVFCDTSSANVFLAQLFVQPRMAPESSVDGPSSTGVEAPGCVDRTVVLGAPVQIDNNANSYSVRVLLGAADPSIQLGSVRVGYFLQVSPAPVTATFDDVPTDHQFFQFIQALAAAGITGGCNVSPPLYCPDNFVTRGQMAVFISRALGLHFAP